MKKSFPDWRSLATKQLQAELDRNRELLQAYKKIGPAGVFGATMIEQEIEEAERAIREQDTVAMIRIFKSLQKTK